MLFGLFLYHHDATMTQLGRLPHGIASLFLLEMSLCQLNAVQCAALLIDEERSLIRTA
jgi:hypothetical protein